MYAETRNVLLEDAYRFDSPNLDAEALMITIDEENLSCSNIADKIFAEVALYKDDYKIFIIDFSNVKQVSEVFFFKYLKYLLNTKLKVFNYNMSLLVESAWSVCVENFFSINELTDE